MRHRGATASPPPSRTRRSLRGALVLLLIGALVGLAVVGYTALRSGDKAKSQEPSSAPSAEPVVTNVALGKVTGKLDETRAQEVSDQVAGLVTGYLEWAYLGDYPRTDWGTPPGFTARAAKQFAKDMRRYPGLTNQPRGGEITQVSEVVEQLTVDILAPKGDPAGATGRYKVTFQADSAAGSQVVMASGRLVLAPVDGTWQIVGYYAGQGAESVGGQS
ncbi:MAG: hypothetical protein V9F00_18230 [Nocardioides sp.]